jgi:hypothetical protein
MNSNDQPPWPDPHHLENRLKTPPEELDKYRGRQVAWSWDGTRVVAAGEDLEDVFRQLEAAGIDSNRVVFSYVDDV